MLAASEFKGLRDAVQPVVHNILRFMIRSYNLVKQNH